MKVSSNRLLLILLNTWFLLLSLFMVVGLVDFASNLLTSQIKETISLDVIPGQTKLSEAQSVELPIKKAWLTNGSMNLEYNSKIRVSTSSIWPQVFVFAYRFFMLIGVWLIIFFLRGLVVSIKIGYPFSLANFKRLRLIGYILLSFWILNICKYLFKNWFSYQLLKNTPYTANKYFTLDIDTSEVGFSYLFCGLSLLVLAKVFALGFYVQKENELTI